MDQGLLSLWFVATEVSTVIDSQDPVATASGVKPENIDPENIDEPFWSNRNRRRGVLDALQAGSHRGISARWTPAVPNSCSP